MKATKLLIASAVFAGLTALSFAGPGPEYWARMHAAQKTPSYPSIWKAKAPAEAAKILPTAQPVATVAATCASCSCCGSKKS